MSENGSDSESSDSSNEFMVSPDKIKSLSPFFAKPQQRKPPVSKPAVSSDDSESDFDYENDAHGNNDDLMAQVLKNLEAANKNNILIPDSNQNEPNDTKDTKNPSKNNPKDIQPKKTELTNEIADLLLLGETGATASTSNEDPKEPEQDLAQPSAPANYSIPKEGVKITLVEPSLIFNQRRKKKEETIQDLLKKKLNQQLRSNQVLLHKVGLLCWLAHGFYVNKQINNPILLSSALKFAPKNCYPKGRADLAYLEKITKWFIGMFTMKTGKPEASITTLNLLRRLKDKEVHNYQELVLLYVAILRALGLTCRLVISLQPPPLKVTKDQLIAPEVEAKEKKQVKKEGDSKGGKTAAGKKAVKAEKSSKSPVKQETDKGSNISARLRRATEARKRAAEVLKGKKSQNSNDSSSDDNKPPAKKLALRSKGAAVEPVAAKKTKSTAANSKNKDDEDADKKPIRTLRSRAKTAEKHWPKTKKDDGDEEEDKEEEKTVSRLRRNDADKKSTKTLRSTAKTAEKHWPKKKKDDGDEEDDDEEEDKEEEKTVSRLRRNDADKKSTKTLRSRAKTAEKHWPKKKKVDDDDEDDEYKMSDDEEEEEEEEDEEEERIVSRSRRKSPSKQASSAKGKVAGIKAEGRKSSTSRRLISSDEEYEIEDKKPSKVKKGRDMWAEVYVESEENWISISVADGKIHCTAELYKNATDPVLYVMAWNSEGQVRDVTRRYCPHWLTLTRKQRIDEKWWLECHTPWKEPETALTKAEDEMLKQKELEQPLPKTVSECKGHPLYVLPRHLLKFEALYPPDVVPLGYVRGEPIYSRHCVHTLCSRETWVKNARVVRPGESCYKVVKARPKYDKLSGARLKDEALEVFGKWQTDQYVPPEAKDGKVPRNEYGNVDLFKECMLPKGTVHIQLPALNRVARKLDIDCVPAVVGFNFGGHGALPAFDGFIVCEEFEDVLREAWEVEQVEADKRAIERYEKRVYGNWRKLIKAALIRERLTAKYDFNAKEEESSTSNKPTNKRAKETKGGGKKAKVNSKK